MRQEKERFFQIIFEENSHVLFRYICGQLNNDRETAKDVLNDVWEVLVVKFETVADLEGEEMTKWLFCVAKNKIKNQRRKHYYQNEVSYTQYQKENRNEGEAAATAEIEERMVMQNCIQNLNPMDQRIFWADIDCGTTEICDVRKPLFQCGKARACWRTTAPVSLVWRLVS